MTSLCKILSIIIPLFLFLLGVKGRRIFTVEEELLTRPNDAGVLGKLELKRKLNEYASPIANLNDLLYPFTNEDCMVVLYSYRIVDFPMLGYPVISIKPQPVYADFGGTFKNALWYPTSSANINMTESSAYCPNWNLGWDPLGVNLYLEAYSMVHKPWRCRIELTIQLLLLREHYVTRPTILQYYKRPPLVPNIEIMVDVLHEALNNMKYQEVCSFSLKGRGPHFLVPIFLIATLVPWLRSGSEFKYITGIIEYKQCRPETLQPFQGWKNTKLEYFRRKTSQQKYIHISEAHEASRTDFQAILLKCYNPLTLEQSTFENALQDVKSWNYKILTAQAYIIHVILGNYSIVNSFDEKICSTESGTMKKLSSRESAYHHLDVDDPMENIIESTLKESLFVFNNTAFTLRFIVCGSRNFSRLPFEQLQNVFLPNVWVTLQIVFSSSSAILVKFSDQNERITFPRQMFAILRCLLEQGDQYRFKKDNYRHVKIVLFGIFGACLLLSNAYRNKNVFEMVLPRQRLAYQKVSQLRDDNFTFFTQTRLLYMEGAEWAYRDEEFEFARPKGTKIGKLEFYNELFYRLNWKNGWQSSLSWERGELTIYIQSEISPTIDELSSRYSGENEMLAELSKICPMHPEALVQCLGRIDNLTRYPAKYQPKEFEDLRRHLIEWHFENEERILTEEIAKCGNVAVIAPALTLASLKRSLVSKDILVDIGKEEISNGAKGYSIYGFVSLITLRRLWGMHESGIINWWHTYLDPFRRLGNTPDNVIVTAAKISGNILVVFVVLLVGISISLFVFCTENCLVLPSIISALRKSIRSVFTGWLAKESDTVVVLHINVKPVTLED